MLLSNVAPLSLRNTKVAGLFCLGFPTEAAELGFYVYETRACHPKYVCCWVKFYYFSMHYSHRHVRYALFFHCLAMVACIRHGDLEASVRDRYLGQITSNQEYIKKYICINMQVLCLLTDSF